MAAAGNLFWDDRRLAPAPSAHRLGLGDRSALFDARRQQLYELNPTADAIWQAIASEGSVVAAADVLAPGDAQVLGFVRQAADAWLRGGQLYPVEVLSAETRAELTFELDELRLDIRVCGDAEAVPVLSVFGQFASEAQAERSIALAGLGGLVFMLDGEQPLGAWDERSWIPELKARITELYANAAVGGFLAHGALLSRGGEGLLLCGEPGGGKTTLSVALAAHGFDYHGDDIARIDAAGRAAGAPFCPALKSGAWTLLRGRVEGLDELPVYLRSDGQEVRYLPVPAADRRAIAIGAVLLLDRRANGAANVEAVQPLDVLRAILASAYSVRGEIDAGTLQSLAATVSAARCGRLTYAALDEAVRAIDAFLA